MLIACVSSSSVFLVVLHINPAYTFILFQLFVLCFDASNPFLLLPSCSLSSIIILCSLFVFTAFFPLFPFLICSCIGVLSLVSFSCISFTSSMSFAVLLNLLLIILLKDMSLYVLIMLFLCCSVCSFSCSLLFVS